MSHAVLSGLARRLVSDQLIDEPKALEAQQAAIQTGVPFIAYIVQKHLIKPHDAAKAAPYDFGLPLLDLDQFDLKDLPRQLMTQSLLKKHHALPLFKRGDRLYIAISDPTNINALNVFKFNTGINTQGILVEENKLATIIEKIAREQEQVVLGDLSNTDLDELSITTDELNKQSEEVSKDDNAPIVRFINKILLDAINTKVSDIHFEPYEKI